MSPHPTRRETIALLGSAAVATAGCLGDGLPGATTGDTGGDGGWMDRIGVEDGPATASTTIDGVSADAWPNAKRDAGSTASAPGAAAPYPPLSRRTLTSTGQEAMRTPAVDGAVAVCLTGHPDGVLRGIDPTTGDRLWSRTRDDLGHASPALAGGRAVVPWGYFERDEHLTAVAAWTGADRWEVDIAQSPACDPVVAGGTGGSGDADGSDGTGGTVYAGTDGGARVAALDAGSGERCVTLRLPDPTTAVTRLAVGDGRLYAGTYGFESDVPDVGHALAYDPVAGSVAWTVETGAPVRDLAVVEGTVHVATGTRALALDGETGAERWSREVEGGRVNAVAVDGDGVYLGTGREVLASAPDGSERWRADAGGSVGVAVAGDAVYAAGRDGLAVVDAEGRVQWRDEGPTPTGGPAVAGGRAYLGTDDGRLLGYEAAGPRRPETGERNRGLFRRPSRIE